MVAERMIKNNSAKRSTKKGTGENITCILKGTCISSIHSSIKRNLHFSSFSAALRKKSYVNGTGEST